MARRTHVMESPIGALEALTLAHWDFRNEHLISQRGDYTLAMVRAGNTGTRFKKTTKQSEVINANLPRFNYDPITGAVRGLFGEGARTQMLLQSGWAGATSGNPGAAPTSWTLGFGAGAVTAVETSIYGSLDAAQAVRMECDNSERVYFAQSVAFTAGQRYCISAYLEEVAGSIGDMININAGTGTFTLVQAVTSPGAVGRYTYIVDCTGSGTGEVRIGVGTTGVVGGPAVAKISRPQCEAGRQATSYIPSTTGTVVRALDATTVAFTVAPPFTVFCEFFRTVPDGTVAEFPFPFAIDQGSSANCQGVWCRTDNQTVTGVVRAASVDQGYCAMGVHLLNARNRIAIAYPAPGGTMRGSLNGAAVVVSGACASSPTPTTLRVGNGDTPFQDAVMQLAVFSGVLSDARLQALALGGM